MIIKVCGLRESHNIQAIDEIGANWIGFIFYPRSPRFVSILPSYLPQIAKRIGVFVNATSNFISKTADMFGLWGVQLHGNESPEQCSFLRSKGLRVIKACSIATVNDIKEAQAYSTCSDYLLFDTKCSDYGGSGKSFDWKLLQAYKASTPFLLSGGLRPESADELKEFSHPALIGYDLNSGFELRPALKDVDAVSQFIKNIKS